MQNYPVCSDASYADLVLRADPNYPASLNNRIQFEFSGRVFRAGANPYASFGSLPCADAFDVPPAYALRASSVSVTASSGFVPASRGGRFA